jgi:biopolymer transport protein ExbB
MEQGYGIAHFLAQSDAFGKTIIIILLAMSAASWYVILLKILQNIVEARVTRRSLAQLQSIPSLAELLAHLQTGAASDAAARIAADGMEAAEHCRRHGAALLADTGAGELVTRALRARVLRETGRREWGLSLLAATASCAPFIGLLGTVWGIYQALVQIGMSGQGTLDKVAGPVGEALVMTAAGLFVAIPAVLAYNFFVRANRNFAADLGAYSQQLFTMIATGARLGETITGDTAAQARAANPSRSVT